MPTTTTPRMPVARLALAAPVLALVLGACGTSSTPGAPSGSGSTAGPTGSPSGTASDLTLDRSGGVAGFADRLSIAGDGTVTGTTKSGTVDCSVPAQTVQTLSSAAAPSVPPAAGTDRLRVVLGRDSGRVDLGEAQGGDPLSTAAREVLDDVQLPEAQRTVCR